MRDRVSRGQRRNLVTLLNPSGLPVPDGDGGFTQDYVPANSPTRQAEIKQASARNLERVSAGTVLSTASQIMTMDFHPEATTQSRVSWLDAAGRSHTANVISVDNPEELCIDSVLVCVEVVK